jgi:hypothetical protein
MNLLAEILAKRFAPRLRRLQGVIPGDVTAEAASRDMMREGLALRQQAPAGSISSRPHFDPFQTSDYLPERNDSEVLLQ